MLTDQPMQNPSNEPPFGALRPGPFDRAVIAATSALPNSWLGLRLAIGLRRLVTMRLARTALPALDVERWGLGLRLHPLDNGCEKNLLFTPNMYEPAELAELAKDIAALGEASSSAVRDASPTQNRRPFVFVDIGANVGLFSLFVAARARGNARIVAIEPEPGNMARLAFNAGANGRLPIRPLALALGEREGEVAIALNARDRGGTRARPVEVGADDLVRVPCRPLLSVLRAEGIAAIDALKIDVEGMEDAVLAPFFREAPETLWPRMILIEDSRHEWKVDLFAVLAAKGYREAVRSKQNVVLRR
jgi:FkbM family methyltransferase